MCKVVRDNPNETCQRNVGLKHIAISTVSVTSGSLYDNTSPIAGSTRYKAFSVELLKGQYKNRVTDLSTRTIKQLMVDRSLSISLNSRLSK